MHGQKTIFLTREEAITAIRADFTQYAPQTGLLCELLPVVMGNKAVAVPDETPRKIWIKQAARGPMRPVSCDDLADALFVRIQKESVSLQRLADICAGVFKEAAVAGYDRETRSPGIWIETGMDGYNCRQCGQCCLTLDYHQECTADDYRRWQALGRDDILRWVRVIPGQIPIYRIWVEPGTEKPVSECPFLQNELGTDRHSCGIHDVKPGICRQYPFTRKHALMTGCPGFNRD